MKDSLLKTCFPHQRDDLSSSRFEPILLLKERRERLYCIYTLALCQCRNVTSGTTVYEVHHSDCWLRLLPVPSCSRWWQRCSSSWASCSETPSEGTNQGAKHESTRVHAANAVGDTSWSHGSWEPDSLSELASNRKEIKQANK